MSVAFDPIDLKRKRRAATVLLCLGLALHASPSRAASSLLSACFPPEAIRARAEERAPVKGIRTFDAPSAKRDLSAWRPIAPPMRGAIRRVNLPPGKKLIAITFDLCEQTGEVAGYDGAIFDYLRDHRIKATFFTGGKWMRSHAQRFNEIVADPLFELASHSEAHRNLRLLSGEALNREIMGPQYAYEAAREAFSKEACVAEAKGGLDRLPPRLNLFRFPFGACHGASLDAVNDAGFLAIQWDVSTGDPAPNQSASAIAEAMIKRTKPGSIIIAHANGRGHNTSDALPLALPNLKDMGYEFVTVSELLAAGEPEIVPTCYDGRPGDTDKYDTFFTKKAPEPSPATTNESAPSVP